MLEDFILQHGLTLIRKEDVEFKPLQFCLLEKMLQTSGNLLVSAPTGSGKTFLFFAKASKFIQQEKRVLFLVTQKHLANQAREQALQYFNFSESSFSILSGEVEPEARSAEYKLKKAITIVTPECLVNDLRDRKVLLNDYSLVGFDEVHHSQGEYSYVPLIEILKKEHPQILRVCFSATPAKDLHRMQAILMLIEADHFLYIEADKKSAEDKVRYLLHPPKVTKALEALKSEFLKKLDSLRKSINTQLTLFDQSSFPGAEIVPSRRSEKRLSNFQLLEKFRARILNNSCLDSKKRNLGLMLIAEMGLISWYIFLLERISPIIFLESFLYLRIKSELYPSVFLSSLERQKKKLPYEKKLTDQERKEKRERVASFERNLSKNSTLRAIAAELSEDLPYEKLLSQAKLTWDSFLETVIEKEQINKLKDKAKDLPFNKKRGLYGKAAEVVFDNLLIGAAHSRVISDAKIQEILALMQEFPNERIVVFSPTRRHAKFIHAYLRQQLTPHNVPIELGMSTSGPKSKREVIESIRRFDSGESKILVITDFGREGKDIRASIGIETVIKTDPISRQQGRGRIGRTGKADEIRTSAFNQMFYLANPGEALNLKIAQGREKHMRKAQNRYGQRIILESQENTPPAPGFLF